MPGEGKMAEIVRAELQLEAVAGLATLRRGHDAGIVDQEIKAVLLLRELPGELGDRSEARKVYPAEPHVPARDSLLDRSHGFSALLGIAPGDHNACASTRQGQHVLVAQPASAGDDCRTAVLRWHVLGGPLRHRWSLLPGSSARLRA